MELLIYVHLITEVILHSDIDDNGILISLPAHWLQISELIAGF